MDPLGRNGLQGAKLGQPGIPPSVARVMAFPNTIQIEDNFPWIVIENTDSVTHTLTLVPRNEGDQKTQPAPTVAAGGRRCFPTTPFQSIACDSGGTPGDVFAYYSDVFISDFRPAAGSGAATFSEDFGSAGTSYNPLPSAGYGAFGLGALATPWALTPKGSGIVELDVVGYIELGAVTNEAAEAYLIWGTGSAPAQGGAVGANIASFVTAHNPTAGILWVPFHLHAILPLTAGTAYWFDIAAKGADTATDAMVVANISAKELGQ